ncbi:uridine kinase family-domain-containing protein [Gongronella butleri]|nr:uridine kinase family-domain-containing protein [Gongronella butleri]
MSIDSSAYTDPSYFKFSLKTPMLVGIAGGPQAGKLKMCQHIRDRFKGGQATKVAILSLTDFYRELTPEERSLFQEGQLNLDHPNMFDFDALVAVLELLLRKETVTVPVWDRATHTRKSTRTIEPVDAILLEGTLLLCSKRLRELMFMKVYIDVDSDERLTQRVRQLTSGEGRVVPVNTLLNEYVNFVKPMFEEFVAPSKKYADIIVPRGVENLAALQVLENHLGDHLRRGARPSIDTNANLAASIERSATPTLRSDVLAQSAQSPFKNIPQ